MPFDTEALVAAPANRQFRLIASAINELTVVARGGYRDGDLEQMYRVNEAIHALSGHLRDILADAARLTRSRAEGVIAAFSMLSPGALQRLQEHNPL
jgi:hypothetical protein